MHIRLIDYIGNLGGSVRFTVEIVRAWKRSRPDARFELISEGQALERYAGLFKEAAIDVEMRVLPAESDGWSYRVLAEACQGNMDALWFPWLHRHQLPAHTGVPLIASLHDVILLDLADKFTEIVPEGAIEKERRLTREWLSSDAAIATSSRATVQTLERLFGKEIMSPERCRVIPVAASHAQQSHTQEPPAEWTWINKRFILCPANISPHKNHETLLAGYAQWAGKKSDHPLVLTGQATHLHACKWQRAVELRDFAIRQGLTLGENLITLGYVADPLYYGILNRAWALVMPTLGEGGGSFPVAEAVESGIPVICSDIPVLREQMERMGASVQWFDPKNPDSLAGQFAHLGENYAQLLERARLQRVYLHPRSWADAAREYQAIMMKVNTAL